MMWSPSLRAFFDTDQLVYQSLPSDLIAIDPAQHAALMAGQAAGLSIIVGQDGAPVLVQPPAPTIEQRRATASRKRLPFMRAALEAQHITPQEFLEGNRGQIPAGPIEEELQRVPEPQRTIWRGEWAGLEEIDRMHPAVELIRIAKGMTQAQMDALFGLTEN
jgi:hypothetical protein